MTTNVLSPNWQGHLADPIDPASIRFGIAPTEVDCLGCVFLSQRAKVCMAAAEMAKAAGGFDCDELLPDGRKLVYVLARVDARQVDFVVQGGETAAVTTESPITNN